MSVNKVTLIGRLGQDPEIRMTQSGQQVATVSIATSRVWVKDGQKQEETEWHRCVLWGKLAETAEKYLKKGRNVAFFGRLKTRSWDDAEGKKHYATEIIVEEMDFVEASREGQGQGSAPQQQRKSATGTSTEYQGTPEYDEDVPF